MKRDYYLQLIKVQYRVHPICAILGPRQVGKTTLAHAYVETNKLNKTYFFDLEDPIDLVRLENPMTALSGLPPHSFIVIDEIQRRPDLFPVLRVIVDKYKGIYKFLILGSASRDLLQQSSETLAGRIGYLELPPFSLSETGNSTQLWNRGGFPLSYLAQTDADSLLWRKGYITTFLERDIPSLGFDLPAQQLRRFWMMLAHYHGQIFNASELSRSLGISDHTVRKYLDILAGTFMVRILLPWFENLKKRQVKSPKIYFRDSGVLHALLGIQGYEQLQRYPNLGAFWEGFALEEVIRALDIAVDECFFWATHADAELDLLVVRSGKRIGFEFKYMDAPRVTRSMRSAHTDLKLDHIFVIYPGDKQFLLTDSITICGLETIAHGTFTQVIENTLKR